MAFFFIKKKKAHVFSISQVSVTGRPVCDWFILLAGCGYNEYERATNEEVSAFAVATDSRVPMMRKNKE